MARTECRFVAVLGVFAVLGLCSGCMTFGDPQDRWFSRDKAYHFTAGCLIAAAGTGAAHEMDQPRDQAVVVGFSVSLGAGAAKELYDGTVKRTYWSWKDMAWDLIGAAAGCAVGAQVGR